MAANRFPEIDQRTMKLVVGIIALSLPIATNYLAGLDAGDSLTSISESYWRGGWPQTIFVGFLFAIASFLIAYNGLLKSEQVLSKVAACAALGVAMFPCGCHGNSEIIPGLHYVSAGLMFGVLTYFCYIFLRRARQKGGLHKGGNPQASMRAVIYIVCAAGILLCSLALVYNGITGDSLSKIYPNFVYWGETGGLWAFGVSWLTASHVLPVVNKESERFRPLKPRESQPPVAIPGPINAPASIPANVLEAAEDTRNTGALHS